MMDILPDRADDADSNDSKVVKEDKMIEAVLEHLSKDFFPDEPVFRSFIIVIVKIIILNTNHTMNYHYEYRSYK